jgi:transmembrane sensor
LKSPKELIELFNQKSSQSFSEEDKRIIEEWHELNKLEKDNSPQEDLDIVENEMLANIRKGIGHTSVLKFYRQNYFKVAASVFIVASLSLLLYFFSFHTDDNYVTVTSPKGKVTMIKLPDGTSVWVNSGSTFKYPKAFENIRNVYLVDGEAFFDVAHNPKAPFIVHSDKLHVKVLGTAFNVRSHQKLNTMRVTVVRGKVEVGSETETFEVLTKDKEIIVNKNGKERKTRIIDSEKVSSWKLKEINLYDISFEDMILSIENAYDVKISYPADGLKDTVTTLHFSNNDSLIEVLEMIKMIHGLKYSMNGKEVTLEK